jgi:hypothetical protein
MHPQHPSMRMKPNLNGFSEASGATATWREGNTIYMLALEGRCDRLQSYLL